MPSESSSNVPDDVREEAAQAVREALSKHGYAGLTTKKVAAESSRSEAWLYYHYDSKDELVVAFLESSLGWLTDALNELDEPTPREQLVALCDTLLVTSGDEYLTGINIAVMELLSHGPYNETLREPLYAYEQYVFETIASVIQAGVEIGHFREIDPDAAAALIHMATDGATGFGMALENDDVVSLLRRELIRYIDTCIVVPELVATSPD